jgi:uncharacterized protein
MNTDSNKHRLSSYTLSVDLEDTNDKVMLVHGYTGAIDIANKGILSYLKTNKFLSENNIPFSENTWNTLIARGYITTKTIEEEWAFVARMADAFHRRNKLFSGFTFIPSYDCNFRCPYCVESIISKKGKGWSKKVFTIDLIDKAFEAMREISPNMEFNNKQILLYGGEPLLKDNKETVNYIVKRGYELGYRFKAITNGYEIDEFQDLLSPDMIYTLQITVDGNKYWHDQRRCHYRDGGTFDKIIKNIGIALKSGTGVGVRVNTDKNNLDSIMELKQLFKDLGYYDYNLFSLHIGWLYQTEEQRLQKLDESNNIEYFKFKELNEELKEIGIEVSCPSDSLYNNLYKAISKKTCVELNPTGCSAQTGSYVFDPEGDIYSCLEIIGKKEFALGHFSDGNGVVWNSENKNKWHSINIATTPQCSNCKYAFLCHGGCVLRKIKNDSDLTTCESFPVLFRTAVNKAYRAYLRIPNR